MIELVLLWVKDHWRFVAGVASVVIVFGFGYYKGYQHEKTKYEEHLTQDKIQLELLKAEYERKLRAQEEVTRNVTKEYAHAVNELKQYYASHPNIKWVSSPLSTSDNTTISESAPSINAGTQSDQVSTTGVTPLDCASDVLQLLYLQKWVRDQESIQ